MFSPDAPANFAASYSPPVLVAALAFVCLACLVVYRFARFDASGKAAGDRMVGRPGFAYLAGFVVLALSSIVVQTVLATTVSGGCGWFGCTTYHLVDSAVSFAAIVLLATGSLLGFLAAKTWISLPLLKTSGAEGTDAEAAEEGIFGVSVRAASIAGKYAAILGVVMVVLGWVGSMASFCFWSCTPVQEGLAMFSAFGVLGGIFVAVVGGIVYATAKPSDARRPIAS